MDRGLVRKAGGPGFDPQLRCLNFSFLRPSVSAFFLRLVCWNGLIEARLSRALCRSEAPILRKLNNVALLPVSERCFAIEGELFVGLDLF